MKLSHRFSRLAFALGVAISLSLLGRMAAAGDVKLSVWS